MGQPQGLEAAASWNVAVGLRASLVASNLSAPFSVTCNMATGSPTGLRTAQKGSIGCWVRRRAKVWATKNTWPIVELLEHHAGRVVVSKPLRTRAIADAKTKSDMIDAATVAELLAADYLPTG